MHSWQLILNWTVVIGEIELLSNCHIPILVIVMSTHFLAGSLTIHGIIVLSSPHQINQTATGWWDTLQYTCKSLKKCYFYLFIYLFLLLWLGNSGDDDYCKNNNCFCWVSHRLFPSTYYFHAQFFPAKTSGKAVALFQCSSQTETANSGTHGTTYCKFCSETKQ